MSLVVHELSSVFPRAALPSVDSITMHLIVFPHAFVGVAIFHRNQLSISVEHVVGKLALVDVALE